MARFVVIHQRYADSFTVHTAVEADSEALANRKVWPKFPDSEWCWCTTDQVADGEWDIPFFTTGSSLI